jgi:hypothetical protein
MRRPDPLLVAAVVLQWIVTAGVALVATRTGSLFGDPTVAKAAVAASNSLVHGAVPATPAPGYALLLAPVVALTGDVDSVASVVTTVNVVVLAPLCAYFLFELAERAAGRLFAGATMVVWSVAPVVAANLYIPTYHATYVDDVLPALYGLTVQAEFVAMTLSVASAAFAMRAVAGSRHAALVAGLLAGAAIGVTPTAAGVAIGILFAIAVSRKWRSFLDAAIGLTASLVPTLVWRQRALGAPTVTLGHPSWSTFQSSMAQIREYFWSNRLLQWLPIAGTIGMARLVPAFAALAAGWLATASVLVVATAADFGGGRAFISLIPAWPAYALLVAAIPALVPTLTTRFGQHLKPTKEAADIRKSGVAAAAVLLAALPLLLVILLGR